MDGIRLEYTINEADQLLTTVAELIELGVKSSEITLQQMRDLKDLRDSLLAQIDEAKL